MRAFSELKKQTGPDENGTIVQTRVPIVYGDPQWMSAYILQGGTENAMVPSPIMSAWISGIDMDPERRHNPMHEGQISGAERNWDKATRNYDDNQGRRFTVQRYMPVPYKLNMQLDLWTTNTTTKLQLVEQIMVYFNPGVQIQVSSNYFDWTSHFEIEMTDMTWTNRSIPQGTEIDRDVASFNFTLGIWINPPAKVKTFKNIEQFVTNWNLTSNIPEQEKFNIEDPLGHLFGNPDPQIIITPGSFRIKVGIDGYAANEVVLLNKYGVEDPTLSWDDLFEAYGNIELYETYLRLKQDDDIDDSKNDIIGTVVFDEARPNVLKFNVESDTLPSTTLNPVLDIIDPQKSLPGKELPVAGVGQRYLITSENSGYDQPAISEESPAWQVEAYPGDIIEFDGEQWNVSFDSGENNSEQYLINQSDNNQYKWNGTNWDYTYLRRYDPGFWRLQNMNQSGDDGSGIIDPPITVPPVDDPNCSPSCCDPVPIPEPYKGDMSIPENPQDNPVCSPIPTPRKK